MQFARSITLVACVLTTAAISLAGETSFDSTIKPFLRTYCFACHGDGDEISGEVDFRGFDSQSKVEKAYDLWQTAAELVSERVMPPADAPQPSEREIAEFEKWYRSQFVDSVKAHPGFFRPRRLSAREYRNTLHTVFGFPLEVVIMEAEQTVSEKSLVMKLLPSDPPGASGFKNDTSGNPLTTVIWDQYSYLVDSALTKLLATRNRAALERFTGKITGLHITHPQAEQLLRSIARKAYRREVAPSLLEESLTALEGKSGQVLESAVRVELKTILMSPPFLYRGLLMKAPRDVQTPVDDFELAERLSYFLWGDMPDDPLMDLAQAGQLSDPAVYQIQIRRMLESPKARNLAEDFAVQWFSLGEIRHVSDNPPVTDALRSQPIDFLNYLFVEGRPLIELIDSDTTFINPHTAKFYPGDRKQMASYKRVKGIEVQKVANSRIKLVRTTERGGLLTMPGVLSMNRGPVLRGTWILERVLGRHLPDPPANVGVVAENKPGEALTFRERFEAHRSNPSCAVCHDKIDPIGFALGAYDSGGGYMKSAEYASMKAKRKGKSGKKADSDLISSIDTSGRLPTGESFDNFQELKKILVTSKREPVIRNIVQRMMSYALCRKLEAYDQPTIDTIVEELIENDGTYHDLILQIANSLPFRETVVRSDNQAPN